jgi:tRNA (cytidine/uridine-2'-O-)-methyltransferase
MNQVTFPTALHIVLVEPEIPQNTGNIARTCVAVGAALHLVHPLGFTISDRFLRRAGLDYWGEAEVHEHDNLAAFLEAHGGAYLALFSRRGPLPYTAVPAAAAPLFLVFGRESTGLPDSLLQGYPDQVFRLPMKPAMRSLNLASAATVAIYEVLRQRDFPDLD